MLSYWLERGDIIDPVTAKIIAHFLMRMLTDEESRKRMIVAVLAPIIAVVLIIALMLYLLTQPFTVIASMLEGMPEQESANVMSFLNDYGYNQTIDTEGMDFSESYEGIIFTGGATEVVYYNQMDSRWANIMYGESSTIGAAGCGPTSMAIVISTFTGEAHDPIELANWSVVNGHRCEGNGSYHSLIPSAATAYGLTVEGAGKNDGQKIVDALASGKLVVAIMAKGHFTSAGHFIVLRGVTEDGKILVADPASYSRSEQEWDLSIILDEARNGASAGGPFWIISP